MPPPPRAITRVTLRLVPLTPIHISDGTEWRPDEYRIETPDPGGRRYDEFGEEIEQSRSTEPTRLCRFDQRAAMRAMTGAQRHSFAMALDRGDLTGAAKVLRETGRHHILERIPLSQASATDLREALTNPLRGGAVKPFIRSGGLPYIPGSSVKGAFRTALASAALPREKRRADQWQHEAALAAAFGLEAGKTETDPLRFLSVSDALLPKGATLIDKAEVMKRGDKPEERRSIQMHYERTLCLLDDDEAPAFRVTLAVDARAASSDWMRRKEACFDIPRLLGVLRDFHAKLFNAEGLRFFEGKTKHLLMQRMGSHLGPKKQPPFTQQVWAPGFILLRLGRFGHFESKSLEEVRRGHLPQARNPADRIRRPNDWGMTRTVTRDAKGNPIPFGWVIGWREDEAHA